MIFLEVLQTLLGIGLHGLGAGLPSSGANFAEFIRKLEGLNQTERLVNRSADWQIVDGNLTQILTVIDDEESAESDAFVPFNTPYLFAMSQVLSASNGIFMLPNPPCFLGVLIQARWLK